MTIELGKTTDQMYRLKLRIRLIANVITTSRMRIPRLGMTQQRTLRPHVLFPSRHRLLEQTSCGRRYVRSDENIGGISE